MPKGRTGSITMRAGIPVLLLSASLFTSALTGQEAATYVTQLHLPGDLYTAQGTVLEKGSYDLRLRLENGQSSLAFFKQEQSVAVVAGRPYDEQTAENWVVPVLGTLYLRSTADPIGTDEERSLQRDGSGPVRVREARLEGDAEGVQIDRSRRKRRPLRVPADWRRRRANPERFRPFVDPPWSGSVVVAAKEYGVQETRSQRATRMSSLLPQMDVGATLVVARPAPAAEIVWEGWRGLDRRGHPQGVPLRGLEIDARPVTNNWGCGTIATDCYGTC